jgi:hypothetical protein
MTAHALTGSQKMLTALIQKGSAATVEDVKAAVAVPAAAELKLLTWQIRGIPSIYLELEAVFQTQYTKVADAVNRFTAVDGIKNINVLVRGIPKPDIAEISAVVAHADVKAIG